MLLTLCTLVLDDENDPVQLQAACQARRLRQVRHIAHRQAGTAKYVYAHHTVASLVAVADFCDRMTTVGEHNMSQVQSLVNEACAQLHNVRAHVQAGLSGNRSPSATDD